MLGAGLELRSKATPSLQWSEGSPWASDKTLLPPYLGLQVQGREDSLALIGNLSSDSGMIKLLVGGNLKPHTSPDERMPNIELNNNDINETAAFSEGVASGRGLVAQQHRPGRNQATAEQ